MQLNVNDRGKRYNKIEHTPEIGFVGNVLGRTIGRYLNQFGSYIEYK